MTGGIGGGVGEVIGGIAVVVFGRGVVDTGCVIGVVGASIKINVSA